MKIAIDENLPPKFTTVLQTLDEYTCVSPCTICYSKDYSPGPRAGDIPWLQKFADDGGQVIVSGEKSMRSNQLEQLAVSQSGLTGFFLPTQIHNWPLLTRAGFVLVWWDRILKHADANEAGTLWKVPPNWGGGDFERVTIATR